MGLMMNVAPKLTVRVPEGMSEENLNHAQNCLSWSENPSEITVTTDSCAHALPAMPDVAGLLSGLMLDASIETAAPALAESSQTTDAPESEAQAAEPAPAEAAQTTDAVESRPVSEAQTAAIPDEYLGVGSFLPH